MWALLRQVSRGHTADDRREHSALKAKLVDFLADVLRHDGAMDWEAVSRLVHAVASIPPRNRRAAVELYSELLQALKPLAKSSNLATALKSLTVLDTLVLNFQGIRSCVSGSTLRWPARLVKLSTGKCDLRIRRAAVQLCANWAFKYRGDDFGHLYEQVCYEIRQKHIAVPIPYAFAQPVLQFGFEPGVDFVRALVGDPTTVPPTAANLDKDHDDSGKDAMVSGGWSSPDKGSCSSPDALIAAGRKVLGAGSPLPHNLRLKEAKR